MSSRNCDHVEWAAVKGKLNTLKFFIEEQHYDPKQKGFMSKTLLHCACAFGHLDIVKYLIEEHQLDPLSKDENDKTPLHDACKNGHLDTVRYLVDKQSVNPDYDRDDNPTGWTPLHAACTNGHLQVVKFLIDERGCDFSRVFDEDLHINVLHMASMSGHTEIARYFIEEKQFNPMSKTANSKTPLGLACQGGHLDVVKYLVNEIFVDPLCELSDGHTPFHGACENGQLEIVKFLIEEKGCNPMYDNGKYPTPYSSACGTGDLEVIRYLTEKIRCGTGTVDTQALNLTPASGRKEDGNILTAEDGQLVIGHPQETHSGTRRQSSSSRQLLSSGESPLPQRKQDANEVPQQKKHHLQHKKAPLNPLPQHHLNPDDLAFLMNCLQPIACHWRAFGLQLGLLPGELDTIANTPLLIPGGPPAFLQEVLKRWLNRALPFPTLTKLCDALRSHAVDQSRTALELEQQYQTWGTAQRWEDNPELKPLVKKAERTGMQLGAGAYGSVEQVKIEGTMYAAKRFRVEMCKNPNESHEKFFAELHILCSIHHPNIVQYHCVCFLPNSKSPALVMEQLQTNLHDYLLNPSYANLPLNDKVSILHDIARGLAYLHNHKPAVIHRDLTARNVLLNSERVAKISDFGNSHIVDIDPASSSEFKSTTHVPGTIIYMPPEACSDHAKFNKKLDIFSFGHLALFTATQVLPCDLLPANFCDDDDELHACTEVERRQAYIDQLEQQLDGDHDLIKLIKQCLHNSPKMRPTADDVECILEKLVVATHACYVQ